MKKLSILLLIAATMVSLTSCLKRGKENLVPGASPMVVQWATAAIDDAPQNNVANIYRTYTRSYEIVSAAKMDLQVDITGTDAASQDITVGVGVKADAISEYNTKYATSYTLLPSNVYTMPTSVVIPKGGRTATVSVILNTTLFDLSKTYALPVTITSTTAGGISGNYGTVIYLVNAKNAYDGLYNYTAGTTANQNLRGGTTASNVALATVDATTLSFPLAGYYTGNIATMSIDPTTKLVTVLSSGGIGTPVTDPSSKYDPTTKTLTVKWTAGSYKFDEKWVYSKSR